ncbi:RCC1-like G exchanging factor-like protein isoform X4 [Oryzias melastigma]|uniref:RCC1-like G exchanging factor-like protein isoform X4 n=1 Tax=Oryzias melastigma TaxID=30732 RepID=UPI00168D5853|nr:RCC1-like G exchanging factor-like protein isoform X4 [Oryzias melastigma]
MFTFLHLTLIELGSVTGVREGPGSINEDHVRRQQHYEDAVGEGDQAAVPLRSSLRERPAEQQSFVRLLFCQQVRALHRRRGRCFIQRRSDAHLTALQHYFSSNPTPEQIMEQSSLPFWMALSTVRLFSRHRSPGLQVFGYATQHSSSRAQESSSGPVFQYVGQHRSPTHKVFVWGFSFTGALGIPSFVVPDSGRKKPRKYQLTPYRLETAEKISSAACGYGFTLLASSTKDVSKVWGMGLNKDSQLGFQRTQRSRNHSYHYVLEPSLVALPLKEPLQTRVVQVACGRAHSLILTDREGVFSLGNNAYGQCGRRIVPDEVYSDSHVIHRIEGFSDRVVQVSCGQDHSLFLTESGKVFACGWGADGQTGLGHHDVSAAPVEVGGDLSGVEVQQVSTYGDCSLAVSRDGQLFGWGNSEYRQLSSITESTQMNSPRRLPLTGCGTVLQAACGGTQVAVLNEKGEVFVWGYGILGKGPNLSESSTPELIPPTLFGRSEFSPSAPVSKIRCGLSHFAAVTDVCFDPIKLDFYEGLKFKRERKVSQKRE